MCDVKLVLRDFLPGSTHAQLTQDGVQSAVRDANKALAEKAQLDAINAAIRNGDATALLQQLRETSWGLQGLDEAAGARYLEALRAAQASGPVCVLLGLGWCYWLV